eukprot:m.58551 g.58551  ORF g.58551 m.58551 type:complete len:113 (+) comp17235_c0_seq1:90-428(+)
MDRPGDLVAEATAAAASVDGLVTSIDVVVQPQSDGSANTNTVTLSVTTVEGTTLLVTLTVAGFSTHVPGDAQPSRFESLEALLDTVSPGYRSRFAGSLAAKLAALAAAPPSP